MSTEPKKQKSRRLNLRLSEDLLSGFLNYRQVSATLRLRENNNKNNNRKKPDLSF
jgi:hypothetical protein